jgi:carboxyl-terminal processing protease
MHDSMVTEGTKSPTIGAMIRATKSGWRFASALLVLLVTACAPATTPHVVEGPPFATEAATETFAAGFSNIAEKYIEPVDVGTVAVNGLRGLGSIDPALSVDRRGGTVVLAAANEPVARFTAPADDDVNGWAKLAVEVSVAGSRASRDLRDAGVERLYEAVFDGVLSNLDIFSRYAGLEEARRQRAKREGFGGIGIRFSLRSNVIRVVSVMPRTPAARTGLRKSDHITHIDGIPTRDMKKQEVVANLRGPVRTKVVLTVSRSGVADPMRFEIEREHIVPTSVTTFDKDGVVFIKVTGFNRETARSMAAKLKAARRKLGKKMKGVTIDLRGNPGGLLKQSIKMADLFLAQGEILRTKGRHPDSVQYYEASGGDLAFGLPVIVLIDGKSASAAEIVAAALQDRGRAVIIGTTSFGKGTVQTVIRLPNDGEITLTWSRFITPAGYALHRLGVRPTICTSGTEEKAADIIAATFAERVTTTNALTAWRKIGPYDETQRRDLRATCPAERRRLNHEVEVARRLLADRALYSRALDLLTATTAERN